MTNITTLRRAHRSLAVALVAGVLVAAAGCASGDDAGPTGAGPREDTAASVDAFCDAWLTFSDFGSRHVDDVQKEAVQKTVAEAHELIAVAPADLRGEAEQIANSWEAVVGTMSPGSDYSDDPDVRWAYLQSVTGPVATYAFDNCDGDDPSRDPRFAMPCPAMYRFSELGDHVISDLSGEPPTTTPLLADPVADAEMELEQNAEYVELHSRELDAGSIEFAFHGRDGRAWRLITYEPVEGGFKRDDTACGSDWRSQ